MPACHKSLASRRPAGPPPMIATLVEGKGRVMVSQRSILKTAHQLLSTFVMVLGFPDVCITQTGRFPVEPDSSVQRDLCARLRFFCLRSKPTAAGVVHEEECNHRGVCIDAPPEMASSVINNRRSRRFPWNRQGNRRLDSYHVHHCALGLRLRLHRKRIRSASRAEPSAGSSYPVGAAARGLAPHKKQV
jgi:hypothetical protein